MRIFKLFAMFAVGYLIYDVLSYATELRSGGLRAGSRRMSDEMEEGQGRLANFTGAGRGISELVEDSDGAQTRTLVGRGVVHR
jgi:hypothetical protein